MAVKALFSRNNIKNKKAGSFVEKEKPAFFVDKF